MRISKIIDMAFGLFGLVGWEALDQFNKGKITVPKVVGEEIPAIDVKHPKPILIVAPLASPSPSATATPAPSATATPRAVRKVIRHRRATPTPKPIFNWFKHRP